MSRGTASSRMEATAEDTSGVQSERRLRAQSAVVRTLQHTLEQFEAHGDAPDSLREQLVEELDRLARL